LEKAGLGAGFFLHPLGDNRLDIRLYAVVAFGGHGFAACMAFA
jgi:two-component system phosphate regulon sensor histidine kinase PhoR